MIHIAVGPRTALNVGLGNRSETAGDGVRGGCQLGFARPLNLDPGAFEGFSLRPSYGNVCLEAL